MKDQELKCQDGKNRPGRGTVDMERSWMFRMGQLYEVCVGRGVESVVWSFGCSLFTIFSSQKTHIRKMTP